MDKVMGNAKGPGKPHAFSTLCLGAAVAVMLAWAGLQAIAAPPNEEAKPVSEGTIKFDLGLFKSLDAAAAGKNVFLSPSSVDEALRMAMAGAGGETLEAMQKTLGGAERATPVKTDYGQNVTLEKANSLWANARMKIRPDYVSQVQREFDARVSAIDMASPESVTMINQWVSDRTHGKIQQMVDRLDAQTAMLLINAIYFKGKWSRPFNKDMTKEQDFHSAGGGVSKVQMMSQQGRFEYQKCEGFQEVKLPYGDGRIEMLILLPDANDGLDELIRKLSDENWKSWMQGFDKSSGELGLPRFKVEYESTLNDVLKAMGMEVAFDKNRADFSKIVELPPDQRAYISEVKHKAVVEVNEEGTEAAAATSVRIGVTSARPSGGPFQMIVDHPFLCAIRDSRTGELLFMGAIRKP